MIDRPEPDIEIVHYCEIHDEEYPFDGQCHECWMIKRRKEITKEIVKSRMTDFDELMNDIFGDGYSFKDQA